MQRDIAVYRILISCPSDITEEVKIIKEELENINTSLLKKLNIRLETLYWEDDILPEYGNRTQDVINKQIVENADAIIAIFGEKIGSNTGKCKSGTIEEIEEIIKLSKKVFVYFSAKDISRDGIDKSVDEIKKINEFKKEYGSKGIYSIYKDNEEFRKKINSNLLQYAADIIKKKFNLYIASASIISMVLFIILISFCIYKINSLINDTTETKITTEYITIPLTTPPDRYKIEEITNNQQFLLEYRKAIMFISLWQNWYNVQVGSNYYHYTINEVNNFYSNKQLE